MKIILNFRGPVTGKIETPEFRLDVAEGCTLHDVIKKLFREQGHLTLIWPDINTLESETMILLNEVDIALLDGLGTSLQDKDRILILPLVHGG